MTEDELRAYLRSNRISMFSWGIADWNSLWEEIREIVSRAERVLSECDGDYPCSEDVYKEGMVYDLGRELLCIIGLDVRDIATALNITEYSAYSLTCIDGREWDFYTLPVFLFRRVRSYEPFVGSVMDCDGLNECWVKLWCPNDIASLIAAVEGTPQLLLMQSIKNGRPLPESDHNRMLMEATSGDVHAIEYIRRFGGPSASLPSA